MESWNVWLRRTPVVLAFLLVAVCTPALRAEMSHAKSPVREILPSWRSERKAEAKSLRQAFCEAYEHMRAEMRRAALEAMATMFFIRGAPAPAAPTQTTTTPPPPEEQSSEPPPVPPPPPPPSGSGEPAPTAPPPEVTAQVTPEPASLVMALLGSGALASWLAWRRRQKSQHIHHPRGRV